MSLSSLLGVTLSLVLASVLIAYTGQKLFILLSKDDQRIFMTELEDFYDETETV